MRFLKFAAQVAALASIVFVARVQAMSVDEAVRDNKLVIRVDLAARYLTVFKDNDPRPTRTMRVAVGSRNFPTPRGQFRPERLFRNFTSNSVLVSNAIFFKGGIAIQNGLDRRRRINAFTHGSIVLSEQDSKEIFNAVEQADRKEVLILID